MRSVGSYGIRFWYDPLRKAAASARELITAASQQFNLPADQWQAKAGFITHEASGQSIPFGDLVEAATKLPLPEAPKLLTADNRSIELADQRRVDIPAKVNGSAVFGADITLDNMLHGAVRMSPVFGADVKTVDADSIKSMPGVVDIAHVPNGVVVIADTS